jgi:F420-0:gamma-glutamyl ligase
MEIKALHAPLVQPGDDLFTILTHILPEPLRERDILCVVSKVVAFEQRRLVRLCDVHPSPEARRLASTLRVKATPMQRPLPKSCWTMPMRSSTGEATCI